MGVYTEVDIYATFETEEQAKQAIFLIDEKVIDFIKETEKDEFDYSIDNWSLEDNVIVAKISSGRYPHADWQTKKLFEYFKTKYGLIEFEASVMCPETILHWDKDDE